MSSVQEFNLAVGQTVRFDQVPFESRVIGVDRYTMSAFDGQQRSWNSYTLEGVGAPDDSPWKRWWAVDVPEIGPHFYIAATGEKPANAALDDRLSGLVHLHSEGNADLSGDTGALATYTYTGRPGTYAQEVFEGHPRLTFTGIPYEA